MRQKSAIEIVCANFFIDTVFFLYVDSSRGLNLFSVALDTNKNAVFAFIVR